MPNKRSTVILTAALLATLDVASYYAISRHAFSRTEKEGWGDEVLYFFSPEDTDQWRRMNFGCVYACYPLIAIDNWTGTGRAIGCEPLWRLSSKREEAIQMVQR